MALPLIKYTPDMVLADINKKNGLSLSFDDVSLSVAESSDGTWLEQNGLGNTLVRVTATEAGGYVGNVVCSYDRIDVQLLHTMLGGILGLPKHVTTVHQALPFLLVRHGIEVALSDFEDGVVTWGESGATFTLTAAADSLAYVGTADFTSPNIADELQNIVTNVELAAYPTFRPIGEKLFAETLLYSIDFTDSFDALEGVTELNFDLATLLPIIEAASPRNWTLAEDNTNPYSLHGAKVIYNGINTNLGIVNKNYKYVMFIEMPEANTACEGSLILHYNDPVVAEEAPAE